MTYTRRRCRVTRQIDNFSVVELIRFATGADYDGKKMTTTTIIPIIIIIIIYYRYVRARGDIDEGSQSTVTTVASATVSGYI